MALRCEGFLDIVENIALQPSQSLPATDDLYMEAWKQSNVGVVVDTVKVDVKIKV